MPRAALLIAFMTLGLLPAGCARDGRPVPAGRDNAVQVSVRDYRYTPQTVRARAGLVAFRVTNRGRLPHSFNVRGPRRVQLEMSTLLPGESARAVVRLRPGTYRMYCSLGNHQALGEYGRLVVRRP